MDEIYPRTKEVNRLWESRNNGKIKIIVGIRRCGKSYLLNTLFRNRLVQEGFPEDHIFSFAFDSISDVELLRPFEPSRELFLSAKGMELVDDFKFYAYLKSKLRTGEKYVLLLDEIQLLNRFSMTLNALLRNPDLDIYVTGSNSFLLSKDVATTFAGRGEALPLRPLSFGEILTVEKDPYQAYSSFLRFGSLPLVWKAENEEAKTQELISNWEEIYLKDIRERHSIRTEGKLKETLSLLAMQVGSPVSAQKIEATFDSLQRGAKKKRITDDTVNAYISYAEDSFLVEKVGRYQIQGRKELMSPFKVYFTDIGLLQAAISFRSIGRGHILENIVYNHLRYLGYRVFVGVVALYQKEMDQNATYRNAEIDFVAVKGEETIYVQVASALDEENEERELRSLRAIRSSNRKFLITGDYYRKEKTEDGINIAGIFDFLLEEDCLKR
ncbi:MAG: ATP-binding protein [Eubacteriales bacterium]|nr:ATP-binding protein [Eubacteriales bacterium]